MLWPRSMPDGCAEARYDAIVAERGVEDAEDYAAFATDFAYSAIKKAEVRGSGHRAVPARRRRGGRGRTP
jgi:hypothetical protein